MRVDFVKAISPILLNAPKNILISGDLGYSAFEKLSSAIGKRFLNTGVAEQNMMGVAAGIALSGHFTPWVYSIAPFATLRCLEQVRNDICFHRLPVRIVGNGGGFTYGLLGSSHHALEDLAVLKALPNIKLYFPCTGEQVATAVNQINTLKTPSYLRLAISGYGIEAKPLSENPETLTRHYQEGNDLTVIGVGHGTQIILTAAEKGLLGGKSLDIFGISKYPFELDKDKALLQSILKTKKVLVIEEHYLPGSIGESLKATLPPLPVFEMIHPYPLDDSRYGSQKYHLDQCKMSPTEIAGRISKLIK